MTDTFLDDIPEVQMPIAPIQDEVAKYQELGTLLARIKKEEEREKLLPPATNVEDNLLHNLMPFGQGLYELTRQQQSGSNDQGSLRRPSIPRIQNQQQQQMNPFMNLFQQAQMAQQPSPMTESFPHRIPKISSQIMPNQQPINEKYE